MTSTLSIKSTQWNILQTTDATITAADITIEGSPPTLEMPAALPVALPVAAALTQKETK